MAESSAVSHSIPSFRELATNKISSTKDMVTAFQALDRDAVIQAVVIKGTLNMDKKEEKKAEIHRRLLLEVSHNKKLPKRRWCGSARLHGTKICRWRST